MKNLEIQPCFIEALEKKGITEPTKVQQTVIPAIRTKEHVIFQSETGTGKTLAYLLPLFEQFDLNSKAVQLLIVAPTHELSSQIKTEIQSVSDFKVALCIGGAPIKRQTESLKEKPQVVIGGPVRIMELIHLKKLKIDSIKAIVFDEIDRLLSPELRDDTIDLLRLKPENAQMVACSATIKDKIADILGKELDKKPNLIYLPMEDVLRSRITHWALYAEKRDKIDTLRKFIVAEKPNKVLVFCARADDVAMVVSRLQYKQIDCAGLHAKTDKVARKQAIDRFRSGKCPILITSDLAARGLDIQEVTHIVQMDIPSNDDFFVHRAGRTARAGKKGINLVIGDEWELRQLAKLEQKLGFVVYPKEMYNGKIVTPRDIEENTETINSEN